MTESLGHEFRTCWVPTYRRTRGRDALAESSCLPAEKSRLLARAAFQACIVPWHILEDLGR